MTVKRALFQGSLPARVYVRPVKTETYPVCMYGWPSVPQEPSSLADALCDAFTPPDGLPIAMAAMFLFGPIEDARQIRNYFSKAIAKQEAEGGAHAERSG